MFFISLDFYRLEKLRPGYGYQNNSFQLSNDFAPANDGLWLIDVKTGKSKLIISFSEILKFNKNKSMIDAYHYFNHILWSPDNKKFFFMHLWKCSKGKRFMRAFIWNNEKKEYKLLIDNCSVSHHTWISNNELLIFCNFKSLEMGYKILNVENSTIKEIKDPLLAFDGHPFYSKAQKNVFITDTYPDEYLEQSLLMHNIEKKNTEIIGKFYSPPKFRNDFRCDLHPRLSSNSEFIALDSGHRGKRSLIVLKKT